MNARLHRTPIVGFARLSHAACQLVEHHRHFDPRVQERGSAPQLAKQADLLGYSMGGGVAMQVAIRHPEKVRKVVSISAFFRQDGLVKEALDAFPKLTADGFKGSPIETEYKKLSPTPNESRTSSSASLRFN